MQTLENRRRTRRLQSTETLTHTERNAVGIILRDTHKKQQRQKQRKRKVKWWEQHELNDLSLVVACVGIGLVICILRYRSREMTNSPSLKYTTKEFRTIYKASRSRIASHKRLYDDIYKMQSEVIPINSIPGTTLRYRNVH